MKYIKLKTTTVVTIRHSSISFTCWSAQVTCSAHCARDEVYSGQFEQNNNNKKLVLLSYCANGAYTFFMWHAASKDLCFKRQMPFLYKKKNKKNKKLLGLSYPLM